MPPEPDEPEKLVVVRATHVEAPSLDDATPDVEGDPWASDAGEDGSSEGDADDELAEDAEQEISGVAAAGGGSRSTDSAGPPARRGDRRPGLRLEAAGPDARAVALDRRAGAPGHRRAGAHGREPRRGARPLRGAGEGDRDGCGPAHHALRAAPRAGHEGREGRAAQGRPRVRARRDRHPHPRADPGQAGGRRRGPERAPADRAPGRRLPGAPRGVVAADGVARQGRRRQGDRRGPREDAPPAGGGHDGRGEVGGDQRDAGERAAAGDAARAAPGAGGPQAGGAQPLRVDPAPADPGDHEPEDGGQRARQPGAGDGAALRADVAGAHAQPAGAQQRTHAARRSRRCRTSCA